MFGNHMIWFSNLIHGFFDLCKVQKVHNKDKMKGKLSVKQMYYKGRISHADVHVVLRHWGWEGLFVSTCVPSIIVRDGDLIWLPILIGAKRKEKKKDSENDLLTFI